MTAVLPEGLLAAGAVCGELLRARGETVATGEGSCGGLISTALLAVPGASAYFLGGSVIYTKHALDGLLTGQVERPPKLRGASEPWVMHLAEAARTHIGATWGIGEGGATGPSGNPYGDPAGHAWVGVSGPVDASRHVLTGDDDRAANMVAFAIAGLDLFADTLRSA
ncbi:MAG: CinA family protein [Ilumatobacter sp.]|jgi:nicotinamide-nucleotide amidase|uniref:CinA family protein n=1 Tax=Ilumatobacter sp. TaxID=1967498 RepID=UPI001D89D4D2|nr:CinA family protein [Ilumatobacter sp.]MBT5277204.1 CinA family protein [Ilumatobacter sp.]MBT5554508.1 CinA family protein [Ilumatobacter sp.]MBT5866996.1 CinA family protein [Ilumatobacter sp.]MDG0977680.1 CinA family protein [Ilumatobacter sp.]